MVIDSHVDSDEGILALKTTYFKVECLGLYSGII